MPLVPTRVVGAREIWSCHILKYTIKRQGAKGDWDFRISDLVKTLMELIFNPCGEFRWSPEVPLSQIRSLHLHVVAPRIFSDPLRPVQTLKGEWDAEVNGKLPHLFIPSETATLVPEFAVKDLPLAEHWWWWWWWLKDRGMAWDGPP